MISTIPTICMIVCTLNNPITNGNPPSGRTDATNASCGRSAVRLVASAELDRRHLTAIPDSIRRGEIK
jgi:hypothetical protein